MPAEGSVTAASGDRAGFDDAERFVFGAEPVRERWMAARWPRLEGGSNSPACWPTFLYGVGVPRGDAVASG